MSFCYSLFFVIEFVNGGDLMFHMQRMRRLEESHARYLLAGTVLFFFNKLWSNFETFPITSM